MSAVPAEHDTSWVKDLQAILKAELQAQEERLSLVLEAFVRGETWHGGLERFASTQQMPSSQDVTSNSKSTQIRTMARQMSAKGGMQAIVSSDGSLQGNDSEPSSPKYSSTSSARRHKKRKFAHTFLAPVLESQLYKDLGKEQQLPNTCLARFVTGRLFVQCSLLVIVLNAAFLGYDAEYTLNNLQAPEHSFNKICKGFFYCYYTWELLMRMAAFGMPFFYNHDWAWNLFDFALVVAGTYQLLSSRLSEDDTNSSIGSVMRIFRLLKMMKMLRVVRVMRFFRGLRMFFMPLLKSFNTFLWALVMLILIKYVFALIFLQGVMTKMLEEKPSVGHEELLRYWGSVSRSILSLYEAVTGGGDWTQYGNPLKELGWHYHAIFLFYISFITFSVLNVLTAMYVDEAEKHSAAERNLMMVTGDIDEAKELALESLALIDDDGDGRITIEELRNHLETPEMQNFLDSLEINEHGAAYLLWRLTMHGESRIQIERFVSIALHMTGIAQSVDVNHLMHSCSEMHEFIQASHKIVKEMRHRIGDIEARVRWLTRPEMRKQQPSSNEDIESKKPETTQPEMKKQQPPSTEDRKFNAAARDGLRALV